MAGFVRAVAVDLDGTLAGDGRLSAPALRALAEVQDAGVAALLVTGRILTELDADFPGLRDRFDAVVAENGAVLADRTDARTLAEPVDEALARVLAARGVAVRRGQALLACDARAHEPVVEAIAELGLDAQAVRNRSALMVLPAGVSKGTGLLAALHELGISAHNCLAVGDAENDLALLAASEVGVAVGNAVPSLRAHADMTVEEPDGDGVVEVLHGPVVHGERPARPSRHAIGVGTFEDGGTATLPGAQANLLVCGPSGSGKSYFAGLLVERWVAAGYSVLVVDMEGEYGGLGRINDVLVLDLDEPPTARELLRILRQQGLSVVLDLSRLPPQARDAYLAALPPVLEGERAAWGVPHWVVVDEAHLTVGSAGEGSMLRAEDRGYCLISYLPHELSEVARSAIDFTVTLEGAPGDGGTLRARLREAGGLDRSFSVARRRTQHVRHRRKYAAAPLPPERWFHFRRRDGAIVRSAGDLPSFVRALREVDAAVLAWHLEHGDFSRWMSGCLHDRDLAAVAAAIERDVLARRAAALRHARGELAAEVEERFLEKR